MLKPILRTKSIDTKVTGEEYAWLEALACAIGRNMSEGARDVMLTELESKVAERTEATLLAEPLGLRTILLNLLFTVAKGEVMTAEQMQTVIERADAGRLERARKLLAAHVATAPELPSDMPARDNLRFGVSGACPGKAANKTRSPFAAIP